MSELDTFSHIFGHGAGPMIKEMDGVEVAGVDVSDRSCTLILNGWECGVRRIGHRNWQAVAMGRWWTFSSQWELLAWIWDRL